MLHFVWLWRSYIKKCHQNIIVYQIPLKYFDGLAQCSINFIVDKHTTAAFYLRRQTTVGGSAHLELTVIGSDNVLSPGRHQAIIWTNAGILLFQPLGTNFSEI